MTFEQFDKWQEELWKECIEMRDTKGKEYSHTVDRFDNFMRLARELDMDPVKVGWVYAKKHLDSIASFIKTGKEHSTEPIRGRIVDAIVYLTLIGGMIQEKQWKDSEASPVGKYFCECPVKVGDLVENTQGYRGVVQHIYTNATVQVAWRNKSLPSDVLVEELMKC